MANEKINGKISLSPQLLNDIKNLIEQAKTKVATTVNQGTVLLYWNIGKRVEHDILNDKRADYGKEIISTLSKQLIYEYGRGFSSPNLTRMIQLYRLISEYEKVVTLSQKLSWSHIVEILPIKDDIQKQFYLQMCYLERWSVRTLRKKIGSMLFERTAIPKRPELLIEQELKVLANDGTMSPDLVFKNPYFLDFLGLKNIFSEYDLESAILNEIEAFILELGIGFTFVTRQKRMIIDDGDFYLDLLFYHRKLKRLVAIDLKIGKFKAQYKGQMELYLRWLEKYEMEEGENSPIGLILCAEGATEQIELLQLEQGTVRVGEYYTELPQKKLLLEKLHSSMERSKALFEKKSDKSKTEE